MYSLFFLFLFLVLVPFSFPLSPSCPFPLLPFAKDGSSTTFCASCLPGSHGNWRVQGAERYFLPSVQNCYWDPGSGQQKCAAFSIPDPQFAPVYNCRLNEYCSDEGTCTSMTMHPNFGVNCVSGAECGLGLNCIDRKCKICVEGTTGFHIQDENGNVPKTMAATCTNGMYVLNVPRFVKQDQNFQSIGEWNATPRSIVVILILGFTFLNAVVGFFVLKHF